MEHSPACSAHLRSSKIAEISQSKSYGQVWNPPPNYWGWSCLSTDADHILENLWNGAMLENGGDAWRVNERSRRDWERKTAWRPPPTTSWCPCQWLLLSCAYSLASGFGVIHLLRAFLSAWTSTFVVWPSALMILPALIHAWSPAAHPKTVLGGGL